MFDVLRRYPAYLARGDLHFEPVSLDLDHPQTSAGIYLGYHCEGQSGSLPYIDQVGSDGACASYFTFPDFHDYVHVPGCEDPCSEHDDLGHHDGFPSRRDFETGMLHFNRYPGRHSWLCFRKYHELRKRHGKVQRVYCLSGIHQGFVYDALRYSPVDYDFARCYDDTLYLRS